MFKGYHPGIEKKHRKWEKYLKIIHLISDSTMILTFINNTYNSVIEEYITQLKMGNESK